MFRYLEVKLEENKLFEIKTKFVGSLKKKIKLVCFIEWVWFNFFKREKIGGGWIKRHNDIILVDIKFHN